MSTIQNAWLAPLSSPKYLKPYALKFDINGVSKTWELAKTHDSVAVVIYNKQREVFVFVRQFRPAVFCKSLPSSSLPWNPDSPPSNEFSTETGKTWELCAGIIDREDAPVEIAAAEVLEETGYKVSSSDLEKITQVTGVGTSGNVQYLYYTEVEDCQRVSEGGGLAEEGEFVEVVEVARSDIPTFAFDETKPKPAGCVLALFWWLNKYGNKYTS